jgi:hypothetical protein
MNQQPDKLFREKLEKFSTPVSASAWSKVESRLDKKNTNVIWYRVAASLTLIGVASFLLWPEQQQADTKVSENNSVKKKSENVIPTPEKKSDEPKTILPPTEKVTQQPIAVTQKQSAKKTTTRKSPTKRSVEQFNLDEQKITAATQEQPSVVPAMNEVINEPVTETTEPVVIAENTPTQNEGVTIILSADEVNNKYLDKKSLAEATNNEKKPSTLRKLLDKAYDLKNNEDPFGDLRQKKNEILALNFKNDKQRSENK